MFTCSNAADVAASSNYTVLDNGDIVVENAALMFTNFAGEARGRTPAGKPSVCVGLVDDLAVELSNNGWNIKQTIGSEKYAPCYYTSCNLSFDNWRPPVILLKTKENGKKKTYTIDKDVASVLDEKRYTKVDLVIHPYHGEPTAIGGYTVKGYINEMVLYEDTSSYILSNRPNDWDDDEDDDSMELPF